MNSRMNSRLNSEFSKFHPVTNLIYFILGLVLIFYINNPILFVFVIAILIIHNIISDKAKSLKSNWVFYLFIALAVCVINPLFVRRGQVILFYIFDNPVMLESVVFGLKMSLMLVSMFMMFSIFNVVIHADKFLYLFSRFAKQTAFVIMLGLRFIPTLRRRISEISQVSQANAGNIENPGLNQKFNAASNSLMTLIIWSLEDAVVTAQSMRARGYGLKDRERTFYFVYKFTKRDALFIFFNMLFFALFLMTNPDYQIYPAFSGQLINLGNYKFNLNILFLTAQLALPIIYTIINHIKWSLIYNAGNRV